MAPAAMNDSLLLRFAADRPDYVAAQLADSDLRELAELIEELPDTTAARIAARLPSWQLSGLLAELNSASLARIIVAAATDEAVALIAHLHESRYDSLLAASPTDQKEALLRLLEFPAYSVAGLATTDFIRVSSDTPCHQFAEQLANNPGPQAGPVLVVDAKGKYLGMVDPLAVFASRNGARPVAEVATAVEPLNGRTEVAMALTSRQWAHHAELPVVDVHSRLLGVVSRAALERVAGDADPMTFSLETVLAELANSYLSLFGRMLESVLGRSR